MITTSKSKADNSRDLLLTEQSNKRSNELDLLTTNQLVKLFSVEDLEPQKSCR